MYQNRHIIQDELFEGYPPQPSLFEAAYLFVKATGLRRAELLNLLVRDIYRDEEGRLWIHVAKSSPRGIRKAPCYLHALSNWEITVG
jgi:integrase